MAQVEDVPQLRFSGSSSDTSVGERLKMAISEPLAKPDTISNRTANTEATTIPVVTGMISTVSAISVKNEGSIIKMEERCSYLLIERDSQKPWLAVPLTYSASVRASPCYPHKFPLHTA